jgi:hypothetical protein
LDRKKSLRSSARYKSKAPRKKCVEEDEEEPAEGDATDDNDSSPDWQASDASDNDDNDVADDADMSSGDDEDDIQVSESEEEEEIPAKRKAKPKTFNKAAKNDASIQTERALLLGLIKTALGNGQLKSVGAQTDIDADEESSSFNRTLPQLKSVQPSSQLNVLSGRQHTAPAAGCATCGSSRGIATNTCQNALASSSPPYYDNPCSDDDVTCEVQ